MKKMILSALTTLLFSAPIFADDISLGLPGYGGKGCPQGTVSTTLSPDNKELSLIFDEFMVEAGGEERRIVRKSCNIAVPVHVPNGFSISLVEVDYRGYVSLPSQARATFSAEYFFAGKKGPQYRKNFTGYTDDEYLLSNTLGLTGMVWSPCGKDVNLRVNASMLVRSNRKNEEALATVDSADFSAGLVYHYKIKRCKSQSQEHDFDWD